MTDVILQKAVERFQNSVPSMFPSLIGPGATCSKCLAGDSVILTYELQAKFGMDDVMDVLEDQMEFSVLYDHELSRGVLYGRQCCAYADIKFDHMLKVNASTNQQGLVDQLIFTVYDSLEVLVNDLISELNRHAAYGCLRFSKTVKDLLVEFC